MSTDGAPETSPDDATDATDAAERLFVARLRELKEVRGLSIRALSEAAQVPSSTVGGYLSGRHLPPDDHHFGRLLTALGVTDADEVTRWRTEAHRLLLMRRSRSRAGDGGVE